ncbi:MAG: transcriptional repressor LexA [Lachnospiraceae bacterium]
MAKGKISAKQQEILDFIKSEIINRGYPPAVRDICEAVHLKSTSSVHSHLETLEKNGYIRKDPTKPRAIEILDDEFNLSRKEMVNIPVVGTVAAGIPILATENIETYVPMPTEMLPNASNHKFFILNVKGDSMINCGILNGDQIIVEQQETAANGEIIVALVDDSATVKRFYREEDCIRLQPENDTMDPIIIPSDTDVSILGKVIGLMRMNIC